MILDYITWNANPEIINLKVIAIRYYGLFFALSFYLGYVIFVKFFKKEKIPQELLDKLTIYMALGTLIGARLGHCLFYEPSYYLSNPVEIIKVWKGGLASHGGGIGIIIAIILFCRKTKKNFFWVMDRIVIVAALAGFFIRMGNLMNSEIYGIPTKSKYGFVYARSYSGLFDKSKNIKNFRFKKMPADTMVQERFVPIKVEVKLDNRIRNEEQARNFIETNLQYRISRDIDNLESDIVIFPGDKMEYDLERRGVNYVASYKVYGVPKHPTQIYEASAYLLIFLLLLGIYFKKNGKIPGGYIFGLFLITVFSARFIIEIVKENQVPFEEHLALNMGQLLSIPYVLAGVIIFIYSLKIKKIT